MHEGPPEPCQKREEEVKDIYKIQYITCIY